MFHTYRGSDNLVTFGSQDTGKNQVDTLIKGSGQDLLYLSMVVVNSSLVTSQVLYVGGGNADSAVIKN